MQRAVVAGGIGGEFGDGVARAGDEAAEGDSGVLVGVGALGGVGEQQGAVFVGVEQGAVGPGVGGDEAVQLTELGDRSELLGQGDAAADFLDFRRAEGAGVEFEPEPACEGNIEAEFEGGFTPGVAVGAGGDMAADGVGREEVGSAPLHAESVAGIGVVGEPEFLVEGRGSAVEPPAAG